MLYINPWLYSYLYCNTSFSSCFSSLRYLLRISQVVLVVKNLPAHAGDARDECLISGLGRFRGERNGNPLQLFLPENSMGRRAWWATVCEDTKCRTQLNMHTCAGWSRLDPQLGRHQDIQKHGRLSLPCRSLTSRQEFRNKVLKTCFPW